MPYQQQNQPYRPNKPATSRTPLHVRCDNCGADIPFQSIDLDSGTAACFACKQFVQIASETVTQSAVAQHRPPVPAHEALDIIDTPSRLDIRYSKFKTTSKSKIAFLTVFNIMWNGSIFFMLSKVQAVMPVLFMSFHILAGIFMFLWLARTYLNHVDVIVEDDYITFKTGPIAFNEKVKISTADIKQIYVQRYVSGKTNGSPDYGYKLFALGPAGKRHLMLKDENEDVMRYLEYALETRLGIEDRRIAGQID